MSSKIFATKYQKAGKFDFVREGRFSFLEVVSNLVFILAKLNTIFFSQTQS